MKYDLLVSIVVYKPNLIHLNQTLESLSGSDLKIKVALFDNSPQPLQVSQYSCKHPIEYTFNQNNVGYGKAHNQNIFKHMHQCKYLLVLNPDVYFDRSLLPNLLMRMEKDSEIGLCIPKVCHPAGELQLINRRLPRPQDYVISFLSCKFNTDFFKTQSYMKYTLKDLNTQKPFICPTISGCFMLFKSQAFVEVDGFDERYFLYLEDTDLSRRVSQRYKTVVFADLVVYHHWSRGAYKNLGLFITFVQSLISYFNKWGWFYDPLRTTLNAQPRPYVLPKQEFIPHRENSVLNSAQV